jgi:hypothetical protein
MQETESLLQDNPALVSVPESSLTGWPNIAYEEATDWFGPELDDPNWEQSQSTLVGKLGIGEWEDVSAKGGLEYQAGDIRYKTKQASGRTVRVLADGAKSRVRGWFFSNCVMRNVEGILEVNHDALMSEILRLEEKRTQARMVKDGDMAVGYTRIMASLRGLRILPSDGVKVETVGAEVKFASEVAQAVEELTRPISWKENLGDKVKSIASGGVLGFGLAAATDAVLGFLGISPESTPAVRGVTMQWAGIMVSSLGVRGTYEMLWNFRRANRIAGGGLVRLLNWIDEVGNRIAPDKKAFLGAFLAGAMVEQLAGPAIREMAGETREEIHRMTHDLHKLSSVEGKTVIRPVSDDVRPRTPDVPNSEGGDRGGLPVWHPGGILAPEEALKLQIESHSQTFATIIGPDGKEIDVWMMKLGGSRGFNYLVDQDYRAVMVENADGNMQWVDSHGHLVRDQVFLMDEVEKHLQPGLPNGRLSLNELIPAVIRDDKTGHVFVHGNDGRWYIESGLENNQTNSGHQGQIWLQDVVVAINDDGKPIVIHYATSDGEVGFQDQLGQQVQIFEERPGSWVMLRDEVRIELAAQPENLRLVANEDGGYSLEVDKIVFADGGGWIREDGKMVGYLPNGMRLNTTTPSGQKALGFQADWKRILTLSPEEIGQAATRASHDQVVRSDVNSVQKFMRTFVEWLQTRKREGNK